MALGIVAKSVLVVALLALVLLAQCEPQPVRIKQTYQIFLPIVAVSTDARFGTQSGWGNNSCDNTIYRLGMFCGNQHSLIENALFLTINHKGWYDYWGLAPLHPCVWDKSAQRLVDAKACGLWIFNHPGRYWIIGNEPNCGIPCGGEDLTPTEYAKMFYDSAKMIRGADATAKIITTGYAGGNVAFCDKAFWDNTTGGFIAEHLRIYGEPNPDGWGYHVYQSGTPDNPQPFQDLDCFVSRLKSAGVMPNVYVTEFGWSGFDTANATAENAQIFMQLFTGKLEAMPEVKIWMWWEWLPTSGLFTPSALTRLGNGYLTQSR